MTVKSGFFSDGSSYNQADFNAFLLTPLGLGYVLGCNPPVIGTFPDADPSLNVAPSRYPYDSYAPE